MQEKTTKKLSRSAVATVLATSSVVLGLPPAQSNAAAFFSDVKPADFFYSAVNELAEKKIVSGYGDGTYRPFNNVTRGEAAKMLALSLNLNVENAETTQFSDVKKGDVFYKYIAALANKGIISGYPDGTFKPNEVVQRGAMAGMVALGYELALDTNLTHPFKDVDQTYIFNQHIQTLVNLNITKGTSFNTFDPFKAVTRGELAALISRASKANAGKPTYVVDNIIGNKIYINSVGYTIGTNVASYIKAENKSALIGGHIEGTFSGMTLTNVTKLTLNAKGNTNSIYTFDGGNSTYNGTLVVNGSYLKLKNWTLNGQTIVSETPRKSLAQYNRLSEIKIASLASGFIDFTQPTNLDDGILNDGGNRGNGGDGGTLNPVKNNTSPTSPYAPYSEKLKQIHKYVDFTNVTVKNLFVEQNYAYIAAQKEIAVATVRGDVQFAELNFNMRNLYLEGDESLTLYGTHDISTVYKNSYYSVFFNTNSNINTLIVDSSNGWINLGDYVKVDKVIIPPKTTPNDIFDDYRNDNDKIGNIEDNTGGDVDREPIENGIVPDVTRPTLEIVSVEPYSEEVLVTVEVNETGILHYLILPKNDPEPSIRTIADPNANPNGNIKGFLKVEESRFVSEGKYVIDFKVNSLTPVKEYKIYLVHEDNSKNYSDKKYKEFDTKDGTAPQVLTSSAKGLPGGRRIQLDFKPSEKGKYYFIVRKNLRIDPTITVEDVIDLSESGPLNDIDQEHVDKGFSTIIKFAEGKPLDPDTDYVVYLVLEDESGNKSEFSTNLPDSYRLPVRTGVLDDTPPFVTGANEDRNQRLELVTSSGGRTQFFMYFSEKLDKDSAEKPEHYSLSGTGIVNVPGQAPIIPTKVEYSETRGGVLITIPSLTGFVHGDTLRVTVSKKVKDLAENDFENVDNAPSGVTTPRNFAEYEHEDEHYPELTITRVERDDAGLKSKIYYNGSKAGTLYYLVASEKYDAKIMGMKPEDFVAEFGKNPTTEFNDPNGGGKIYLEGDNPTDLKKPLTSEYGNSEFIYDYTKLRPRISSFESYKIYMVLKDRSGRLSEVKRETIISDKEAPKISSFSVESKENDDRSAKVTITSENEGGLAYIGYAEKYIKDGNTFKLNPDIFNGKQPIQYGMDPSKTNAQNKLDFLQNVPKVQDKVLTTGSNNNYEITGLEPHTEYVFYYAVEDAFGNFTVQTKNLEHMVKELYTDGTKPRVIGNYVVKDPFGNFIFTFNESIDRVYEDITYERKTTMNQVSKITTSTPVEKILDIIPVGAGSTLAADKFVVVSYKERIQNSTASELIIRPKSGVTVIESFKVNLKLPDQDINENKKNFALENVIDYQYPKDVDGSVIKSSSLLADQYPNNVGRDRSTIAEIELSLGVETTWSQNYYYAVVNQAYTLPADGKLSNELVKRIIESANGQIEVPQSELISYGKGEIKIPNDLSTVKTIYALQYGRNPATDLNVFYKDSRLFFFTVDRYGNIVWAKNETTGTYYTNIGAKK